MNCAKHPKKEAERTCVGCGSFFCSECLTKLKNRSYCKECLSELLSEKMDTEKDLVEIFEES